MRTICSNSDVSNDVLFRQKDKDCHQVKMWSPTQQLVIKSIVPDFGLQKEAFAMYLVLGIPAPPCADRWCSDGCPLEAKQTDTIFYVVPPTPTLFGVFTFHHRR